MCSNPNGCDCHGAGCQGCYWHKKKLKGGEKNVRNNNIVFNSGIKFFCGI